MTTDLEPRTILNPATGEKFALDLPDDDLIRVTGEMRRMEWALEAARKAAALELLRRMDKSASWTLHAGPVTVQGKSPDPPDEWDVDALRMALARLVEADLIDEAAAKAAVKTEVTYKPVAAGLNKLLKIKGEVEEAVLACKREVDPKEYARSRPAPSVKVAA